MPVAGLCSRRTCYNFGMEKEKDEAKDDIQEIREELRAESEKLKALETRVGAIEQNLLGN